MNYFEYIKYSEFMLMIILKNNLRELYFGTGSSQNLDEISSLEPLSDLLRGLRQNVHTFFFSFFLI